MMGTGDKCQVLSVVRAREASGNRYLRQHDMRARMHNMKAFEHDTRAENKIFFQNICHLENRPEHWISRRQVLLWVSCPCDDEDLLSRFSAAREHYTTVYSESTRALHESI